MRALINAKISIKEAWLKIERDDMTIEEAVEKAREAGNNIIEIDEEGRRIKIHEDR